MAAPNRVEELRKRYHENPRRFFAPLANEYRKTGFPDRAILLCEKHLGEQPDNLNGLVVYGQTLYEMGRQADAKGPFEAALNLDPENLIALRHLGDIAREGGDQDEARRWYERVLEFDRRNEEVLALLESVGGATEKEPPSGPTSAPNIVNVASSVRVTTGGTGGPSAIGIIDLGSPTEPEAPSAPAPRASAGTRAPTPASTPAAKTVETTARSAAPKRASLLDLSFDFGEGGEATAAPAPSTPAPAPPPPTPTALEDMPTLITDPRPPRVPTPASAPLIDLPPAPVELGDVGRIEGLEAAEFNADVAPLGGLEPSEFQSGDVAPLADLEAGAFTGLGDEAAPTPLLSDAIETTAPDEDVLPPSVEERDFGGTLAFSASGLEDLGAPPLEPPRASRPTDGLPLLADWDEPESAASAAPPPLAEPEPVAEPAEEPVPMPLPRPEPVIAAAPEPAAAPMPFVTETMAELYLKQGHRDQAMDVYRRLIAQSPGDATLREKLSALEAAARTSIEFEVPPEAMQEEPAPAPANAMLADMSFDGVALATPAPAPRTTRPRTPIDAPPSAPPKRAVAAGPTAREFLSAFARRGFTPLSSPVIPATPTAAPVRPDVPGGGLDLLFGSDVAAEDDRAAHRLAGVGAMAGPSGGSALDSLFGEGPSAPMPVGGLPGRSSVPRASDKLRFDQFFTPAEGEAAPVTEAPSAPEEAVEESASAEAPPEDDDLDQFQGWLRGLTQ